MPRGAKKGTARRLGKTTLNHTAIRKATAALKKKTKKPAMSKERAEQIVTAAAASKRLHTLKKAKRPPKVEPDEVAASTVAYDIEPTPGVYPNVKAAKDYARRVVNKEISTGVHIKRACARFLSMLDDPRFVFNPDKAQRACNFVERMPHVKGKWKTKNIKLEGWQAWIVCAIFGFYWAHDESLRVVKAAYIEIARKNAKSTLAAAIGLYMMSEDDEEGAEIYSAATTHKQALAIFDTARAMAIRATAWAEKHGITIGAQRISQFASLTKFEALHAQGETLDGLNIYCALIDELHAHKTRAVYDVLETAMGSRVNPLVFNITTAGTNRAGICYEIRAYAVKTASGMHDDPTFFGAIYTMDEGDDWTDPKNWQKANPNLGVSIRTEELERLCKKAQATPAAINNFLTKHLNVWVNAGAAWMDMDAWKRCGDPTLEMERFKGEACKLGADLASRIDIASRSMVFRKLIPEPALDDHGEPTEKLLPHYYAFFKHYLPADVTSGNADEEDDRIAAYPGWVREGHITTTPGNMLDLDVIEEDILAAAEVARIEEAGFDPFQAAQMMGHLVDEGMTVVEVRPTVQNFSQPMKEVQALVLAGRFHHCGDPVTEWMVSNVVCHTDLKDNVYPRKEFQENKIDGVIALLMAMNRWLNGEEAKGSVYETRGIRTV